MGFSLRHWHPRHLLLAWAAYWIVALIVAVGPALASIWRVTRSPDAHGSVNVGVGDGVFTLTVTEQGGTVWQSSAPVMSILLWFAGPPLLLFLVWLAMRPRSPESAFSRPQR